MNVSYSNTNICMKYAHTLSVISPLELCRIPKTKKYATIYATVAVTVGGNQSETRYPQLGI